MSYQAIASKFRRALRNGTGASFTLEQLYLMADAGILNQLAQLEADELIKMRRERRTAVPTPADDACGDSPAMASQMVRATIATVLSDTKRRK